MDIFPVEVALCFFPEIINYFILIASLLTSITIYLSLFLSRVIKKKKK